MRARISSSLFAVIAITVLAFLPACQQKTSPVAADNIEDSEAIEEPNIAAVEGGPSDIHGCYTSAGYQWSQLLSECIRAFEVGVQLDPVDQPKGEATFVCYLVTGPDEAIVEVFMKEESAGVLLFRKRGTDWVAKDQSYKLSPIAPNQYELRHVSGTLLYKSKP